MVAKPPIQGMVDGSGFPQGLPDNGLYFLASLLVLIGEGAGCGVETLHDKLEGNLASLLIISICWVSQ